MLSNLRFVSLLLVVLLFHTPAFGQDNRSLQELQNGLNLYYEMVNNKNILCVEPYGLLPNAHQNAPPIIMSPQELNDRLVWAQKFGNFSRYTRYEARDMLYKRSNGIKAYIRQVAIPDIKKQIANHPDNHLDPISPSNYTQPGPQYSLCPEWNPGNQYRNKFDTNNNPGDSTYVECNYFKDGKLAYQAPYINGKKNGVLLSFKSPQPHHLEHSAPYKNGKRHGTMETWTVDNKSGHTWRLRKNEYFDGAFHGEQITYRMNGTFKSSSMYNYGKHTSTCSYRDDGSLINCKQY